VDPALAVSIFGLGAAAIGFWVVARFPSFGPQTFLRSLLLMGGVFLVQPLLLSLVHPAMWSVGVPGALLFVILPSLTLLFWAAGCLVRSLVTLAAPYKP
jgi:hypothetical protein